VTALLKSIFVGSVTLALVGMLPKPASSSTPEFEIVILQKSSNQIQFAFCINLANAAYTGKSFQMEYRLYEGVKTQASGLAAWDFTGQNLKDSNPTYRPPRDQAVSTTGLVFRYRGNQNPEVKLISAPPCPYYVYLSTGVVNTGSNPLGDATVELADGTVVTDVSQIPQIKAGTTYTIEASIYMHDGTTGTTYRISLVTTTDSGCPINAPAGPELPESAYPVMARIDDTNKVVEVIDRKAAEDSKTARPSENWVPTFATHQSKRLATTGLYYDETVKDFGPKLEIPSSVERDDVFSAARLNWSACASENADFTLTVDPSTTANCRVDGNAVVATREGACFLEVKAISKSISSDLRVFSGEVPTLTRKVLMFLTPTGSSSIESGSGSGRSAATSPPAVLRPAVSTPVSGLVVSNSRLGITRNDAGVSSLRFKLDKSQAGRTAKFYKQTKRGKLILLGEKKSAKNGKTLLRTNKILRPGQKVRVQVDGIFRSTVTIP